MKKLLVKAARLGAAASVVTSGAVHAQISTGVSSASAAGAEGASDINTVVTGIINALLFIVGAGAVIFLIIGGVRYITSQGDQTNVAAAKNTILYSIIGLAVALIAYALVNWVISDIFGAGA